MTKPITAHVERRTQGKYPALPYVAVVARGEVLGTFQEYEPASIYKAGFNAGAERQASLDRDAVD